MDRIAAAEASVSAPQVTDRSGLAPSPLATAPVPLDGGLRWLITLAWVLPAITLAAAKAFIVIFQPPAAGAVSLVTAGLCVAWAGLTILPSWRGLLLDIGRLLLARIGFVIWVALALGLGLVGSSHSLDNPWWALTLWVLGFMVAAAHADFRRSRKAFVFTVVTLALTAGLLVVADLWIASQLLPTARHNVFAQHDPVLGWKLRPGTNIVRGTWPEVSIERINEQGFRAPLPTLKSPGVKRILFLGDSHTEAYGIDERRTYTALVQKGLSITRRAEVIGLGVGGYSTDQELLAYVLYGRAYRPDLVVLQFCSNDWAFNVLDRYWRGPKPRFVRHGDVLLLTNVPVANAHDTGLFASTLLSRSALLLSVEEALRDFTVHYRVRRVADRDEGWRVTALLLRDLDRLVRSDGARLVVFHADRDPKSEARLRDILKTLDVPYLETSSAYRGDAASYWNGPHWNDKGQQAVADVLASALLTYL